MKTKSESTEFGKATTEVKQNVAQKFLNSRLRTPMQIQNQAMLDGKQDVEVIKQSETNKIISLAEKATERIFFNENALYLKNGAQILEKMEDYPNNIPLAESMSVISVAELSTEMIESKMPILCLTIDDMKIALAINSARKQCLLLRKYYLSLPDGLSLLNKAEADFDSVCAGKVGRRTKENIKRKKAELVQNH